MPSLAFPQAGIGGTAGGVLSGLFGGGGGGFGGEDGYTDPGFTAGAGVNYGRYAGILGVLGNVLNARGNARYGAFGGALDFFMPQFGGIFGALGGLIGSLMRPKRVVVDRIIEPVKTLPQELSIFGAGNPASRLYTGAYALLGAAFPAIQITMKGDAGKMFEAKLASEAYDQMVLSGI